MLSDALVFGMWNIVCVVVEGCGVWVMQVLAVLKCAAASHNVHMHGLHVGGSSSYL